MSGCGISGTFYASRKAFRTSIADCDHRKRCRRSGESAAPARVLGRNSELRLRDCRAIIVRRFALPRIPECNRAGLLWRR